MKMIWQLFKDDLKRISSNMITVLVIIGLVLLPSIFSWYNVLACWDVFHNTSNLKVAVVNNDEGYQSDLVPLKVNMGEQVASSLRGNDSMDWVVTTEEDAIDGTSSGKYYAAVVIPSSFSKDMMTFYSDDVEHASLMYYSNRKKNVVAPKLIDQGADNASSTVNEVFSKTLAEVGLNVCNSLMKYADSSDANSAMSTLAGHVDTLGNELSQTSKMLNAYAQVLGATQELVTGSAELLDQAGDSAGEVLDSAEDAKNSVASMGDAMQTANDALGTAISKAAKSYEGVSDAIDEAFDASATAADTSADSLDAQAETVKQQASEFDNLADSVEKLAEQTTDTDVQAQLKTLAEEMHNSADSMRSLADSLNKAASTMRTDVDSAMDQHEEVQKLTKQATESLSNLSSDYNTTIKPKIDQLMSQISDMGDSLSASASTLSSVGDDLQGTACSLSDRMGTAKQKLESTAAEMDESAAKFTELATTMRSALDSGDLDQLRTVLYSSPDALSSALAAPVQLDRHAVYPAENFGSQMAPLYTTLALWVGSLLLVVVLKVNVSRKAQIALGYPKLRHLFLGRYCVFAFVSLLQSTVLALGNMFFLDIQHSEPLLYLLCFWLAGLVFSFIMYTLVVSFANLGKAFSVLLLIIQVTSGGGSYPLQTLPDFFQVISPFLPATHVISAMRAAMMGVYNGDFWVEIGCLLLFAVPCLLLGLLLRKPLMRFLNWYVQKAEDSKLIC